jgi:hypothetical protein
MADITGGCLCGRVRYSLTGEPAFSGLCHCRNCQRFTGSSFEAVVAYPSDAVSIQGELKTYQDTGDSGKPVYRNFCPNCGSGIMAEAEVLPGLKIMLTAGSTIPRSTCRRWRSIAAARSNGCTPVVNASNFPRCQGRPVRAASSRVRPRRGAGAFMITGFSEMGAVRLISPRRVGMD